MDKDKMIYQALLWNDAAEDPPKKVGTLIILSYRHKKLDMQKINWGAEEDFEPVEEEPQKQEAPFRVQKIGPDAYEVVGPEIDGLVGRTQFERDEAVERFMKILDNMGIEKALREAGIQDGDTVIVGPMALDYLE